jgi:hypothetical protein
MGQPDSIAKTNPRNIDKILEMNDNSFRYLIRMIWI